MPQSRRTALLALLIAGLAAAPADAKLVARGSIEQAYVLGAGKGARVTLFSSQGRAIRGGKADRFGSKVFRELKPGPGYRVRAGGRTSARFAVLRAGANPRRAFYARKHLRQGLNYVKVRDGIELAMTVRLPQGKTLADGPFPTLIELSGYQVAAPHDLLGAAPGDPLAPASSTVVGSLVGPLLGYAVVSVQMRGSGCSGGAFGLFDLPTTYDGYDAVETVAAQRWVKEGKVGLAGISFSGITQLFTAGTRPPHLAAITPMSVTDDTYSATGYPGGIFNSGFAGSWIKDRLADARPAPGGGQPYARALVQAGDEHCKANQRLRLQTQDAIALQRRHPFRSPAHFEDRSPAHWMGRIKVPVFLVGQFQDEQTGGHFPEALDRLAKNPKVWITLQNGVHVDALGPSSITRWLEFLDLYVAGRIPDIPATIRQLGGVLYQSIAGAPAAPIQQSRFAGQTDVAAARAAFARDPRVRLLMDNGAGPAGLGSIGATWEIGVPDWPVPGAAATRLFLAPGWLLSPAAPAAGTVSYTSDPSARPATTLSSASGAWLAQPPYDWRPLPAGKAVGFATPPLARDTVIAGPSSLDLVLDSTRRDTDLQVTLSEIRPDGNETYVQSGWLRASHRKLDRPRSTAVDPVPTHRRKDARPLVDGATVRVPIFPVAHAFRAGSRIRVTVEAPGGDRAEWRLDTIEDGTTRNTIHLGASALVLPVLPGVDAQGTPLPAPTALRGEPNRAYVPAANGG
jgi:predicted acyl esterase